MRVFTDCEFVEDGVTIDLISLAAVREDGEVFYAVSEEYDRAKAEAHPFVSAHVLPAVDQALLDGRAERMERPILAGQFQWFCGPDPEFWGDYAAYDWVAVCQLYGTMMDLPPDWPMFCNDVQQMKSALGFKTLPHEDDDGHDALQDALHCREKWLHMRGMKP